MLPYVFRRRQVTSQWWNGLFRCSSSAVKLWSWISAARVLPRDCQPPRIIRKRSQHIRDINRLHCICFIHISGSCSKWKILQHLMFVMFFFSIYWGFSHDVTKIQTRKLLIFLRFTFMMYESSWKLASIHTNIRSRLGPWFCERLRLDF